MEWLYFYIAVIYNPYKLSPLYAIYDVYVY